MCFDRNINGNRDINFFFKWDYWSLHWRKKLTLGPTFHSSNLLLRVAVILMIYCKIIRNSSLVRIRKSLGKDSRTSLALTSFLDASSWILQRWCWRKASGSPQSQNPLPWIHRKMEHWLNRVNKSTFSFRLINKIKKSKMWLR